MCAVICLDSDQNAATGRAVSEYEFPDVDRDAIEPAELVVSERRHHPRDWTGRLELRRRRWRRRRSGCGGLRDSLRGERTRQNQEKARQTHGRPRRWMIAVKYGRAGFHLPPNPQVTRENHWVQAIPVRVRDETFLIMRPHDVRMTFEH
jgi:hypothetical protein